MGSPPRFSLCFQFVGTPPPTPRLTPPCPLVFGTTLSVYLGSSDPFSVHVWVRDGVGWGACLRLGAVCVSLSLCIRKFAYNVLRDNSVRPRVSDTDYSVLRKAHPLLSHCYPVSSVLALAVWEARGS